MPDRRNGAVAIVDYGLGNLFSVMHACERVGLRATITSSKEDIVAASAVILPGVGAFGVAMDNLRRMDLVDLLREVAASTKPLIGICLGMQLLMSESQEFGSHRGLDLIKGEVVRLQQTTENGRLLKVPQVGWNRIHPPSRHQSPSWKGTLLDGVATGEFTYFVHSYYCKPDSTSEALSTTRYGLNEFCSTVRSGNVVGFQFHPERSSRPGLRIYRNLASLINESRGEEHGD